MPFKDPEDKKRWTKEYRRKGKETGYNKALYRHRQVVRENERSLRKTVENALDALIYGAHPGDNPVVWGNHARARSEAEDRLEAALRVLRDGLKKAPPVMVPSAYMPKKKK